MFDLFDIALRPGLNLAGTAARFPANRIFCIGRNYPAHAREMGSCVRHDAPIYFTRSPSAVCRPGSTIARPPGTGNYHFEAQPVAAAGTAGRSDGLADISLTIAKAG